jgi:HSP20 family molecular chaperone IbpA
MSGFRDVRRLGESAANAVLERVGRGMSKVQERKPLAYDVLESDDAYLVVFDAPGATSSDIDVRLFEGEVQVKIDRFREYYEGFEMRFPGRGLALDGQAQLPADAAVEPDEANAKLQDNGSLHVQIPKSGEVQRIDVENGE